MTVLDARDDLDQPFVQATTANGQDRVYVGINDFNGSPRTATVIEYLDAASSNPTINTIRLERRNTSGQDGPQVRPAIFHGNDGTVYAIFYGWRTWNGSVATSDVVICRDDNWGIGTNPFSALVDANDNTSGLRIVTNVTVPWSIPGLGQERIGGDVSIAVDPRNSSTVFVAWADQQANTGYTLHIRNSTDRGVTWSGTDLRTIPNAKNPALAINITGYIGFLYKQLTGTGNNQRWETHLELTKDSFTTRTDYILANTPANSPARIFFPYLGDYDHLIAAGRDFYGIFCANNTPDLANFPSGISYQRNADFTTHTLLSTDGSTQVQISIDPFFVKLFWRNLSYFSPSAHPTFQNYAPQNYNYELVVREGNQLKHYWFSYGGDWIWHEGLQFGSNVASQPAMFQNHAVGNDNYELVVREGNQLKHYWFSYGGDWIWHEGLQFGSNVTSDPAMFQNHAVGNDNYELVVREGNQLKHYWFSYGGDWIWHEGLQFT
jgi:hypothetical protein